MNSKENARSSLDDILSNEALTPHFQAIVDINSGDLIGHEALIRGPINSPFYSPVELFGAAIDFGKLHDLELMCRRLSLLKYAELGLEGKLFLNVSASLLSTPEYTKGLTSQLLDHLNIPKENIVIELSEQHPFDKAGLTQSAVEHYRSMGFTIAIDDYGTGYSGMKLWSQVRPEYIKIDRHFINEIHRDSVKQEFVKAIIKIGKNLSCSIIAEGIETQEELVYLAKLGIGIGQGFLLGMPQANPPKKIDPNIFFSEARKTARQYSTAQIPRLIVDDSNNDASRESADSLLTLSPYVNYDDRVINVNELFHRSENLNSLPVLKDNKPIGIIRRNDVMAILSTPYGHALNIKSTINNLIDRDAIVVESTDSLQMVSRQVTEHGEATRLQDFIIHRRGQYLGMGSVLDLLKRMTEINIQNAHYANPLTQLPGNVPINRLISSYLKHKTEFHVAYFDLNNFKPYNDCYGYANGDEVILYLAKILRQTISDQRDFIGHIGGDDFVAVFRSDRWQQQCESILQDFSNGVRSYYNQADLDSEGIYSANRRSGKSFSPLLALAIGVVHPHPIRCNSHHEVAELAAAAKKEAKKDSSINFMFVSKRRYTSNVENACERINHLI